MTDNKISIVPILVEMRKLLGKGWTQGAFARDKEGKAIGSRDKLAVCWCYRGALFCAMPLHQMSWEPIEELLQEVCDGLSLVSFNDDKKRTKAQVLASVDIAIELAKERGL